MAAREAAIRRAVLRWYRAFGRDLPWRKTRDPYAVLVSEMMLQQQTVVRVVPVYEALLERFPTIDALAGASRAEVVRVWSAIGLNRQAVRLHELARTVVSGGGGLPREAGGLTAFPGIGRYTAAAVLCFAHGERRAMVDTNIRRVLGRVLRGSEDALAGEAAWEDATAMLPRHGSDVYDWNQGLMDLGATVCRARSPKCGACPVARWCAARSGG
ncbi:MAG TPA: A/G-specific adenine glycosylase, partial [Chloroflexota bacterium]|nr:A/G-specific adenine glycosylase [Chloroflexota bacterium]